VPVICGGNGDRALRRVAGYGDGWYGFNVSLAELPDRLDVLRSAWAEAGREDAPVHTVVFVADAEPADLPEVAALGVDELVVVAAPTADAGEAAAWVSELGRRWHAGASP
jgi:alkanesulfonate monooxygenase SsuD/methylene tetrahydromethanopterin reductase-like flavin-dependent oxidoreductase (luciferase family)